MDTPKLELVLVTPEMAREWLNNNVFEKQRSVAPWHIARLAREVEAERFTPGTQIHFAEIRGKLRLVNGQHTLAAICRVGKPVHLGVLKTPCKNLDEVGQLYGRHDRHRSRTPHDAFLALGIAEKLGLEPTEVNALGAGVRYLANNFQRATIHNNFELATSSDVAAEKMVEWGHYAGLFFEKTRRARNGMKKFYMRSAVVAVALPTFRYSIEKAHTFWDGAVEDDGLASNDPRRILNIYLLTHSSGRADMIGYMRAIASAWNNFYVGKNVTAIRGADAGKIGITIAGTPFKATVRGAKKPVTDDSAPTLTVLAGNAAAGAMM